MKFYNVPIHIIIIYNTVKTKHYVPVWLNSLYRLKSLIIACKKSSKNLAVNVVINYRVSTIYIL